MVEIPLRDYMRILKQDLSDSVSKSTKYMRIKSNVVCAKDKRMQPRVIIKNS